MDVHETIKDIKGQFRLFMNGVASQSMREKGLDYKLNFGIELPRLKEIAARYEKNHEVAQALWKENIRECKILAGMLQPVETFYPEIADIWVEDMRYPEIAELTCMSLFQYLPYASEKAFEWMADDREYFQLCGFMLMARLLMGKHGVQLQLGAGIQDVQQLRALGCSGEAGTGGPVNIMNGGYPCRAEFLGDSGNGFSGDLPPKRLGSQGQQGAGEGMEQGKSGHDGEWRRMFPEHLTPIRRICP